MNQRPSRSRGPCERARLAPVSLCVVFIVLLLAGFAPAAAGAAVPSTPAATYGTNGDVDAVARLGNTIYLGGSFSQAGLATGGGAALTVANGESSDGRADRAMPAVSGGNHSVIAAVADGSGGYYIGGNFTHVGGVARSNVAHILADKSVDPSFDPSANDEVGSLALSGSTLYVGGFFTDIGGQARNHIAALDASSGDATSWDPNASNIVRTIVVSGSTVYAGGDFNGASSIGGADRNFIAALDATTGNATSWDPNATDTVRALAISGSTVYVGGQFSGASSIGGADRNYIAALDASTGNATSWDPNANGDVYGLAIDGSTVYAGGYFSGASSIGGADRNNIAALDATTGNATSWNPDASGGVRVLAMSGSTVYAGGDFSGTNSIGGADRNHLAALDATTGAATSWDPNANGNVSALVASVSTVYAGGIFSLINQVARNNLAAFGAADGKVTSWDPNANGDVLALAVNGSTIYAGGEFFGSNSIGGADRNAIAALDASTGNATSWDPNANDGVSALALSGSTVYAGGGFSTIGGQPRESIAALDASTGNATSWDPNSTASINALAVSGSTVYAGGRFNGTSSIGGADRNYIAALDASTGNATSWNPNANAQVIAIAVSGSTVYAGGVFSGTNSIGGADRNYIAALDATTGMATSWNPNASNTVLSLAVSGSTVYAGGDFSGTSSIGGADRNYIAALDASSGVATSWDPNANNEVGALAVSTGAVYAGGTFTATETTPAAHFAAFVEAPANTALPTIFGIPSAGHNLTCLNGSWSGGTPQTYAYQWLKDNVAISGENNSTYAVQSGDTGHVIKCRVTAFNLGGQGGMATSAGRKILAAPHNTTAPSISGTPVAGHTLTCKKGTWTGSSPITYTRRWLRNGVAITGATNDTYVVKSVDAGKQLRCRVTASNGGGSTIALSASLLIKTPPKNTVAPTITGTPKVGKTLTCNKGTWTGSAPITYTRQWLRNGAPIAGATGASYVAKAADKNKFLRCRVTAKNIAGQATKASAAVKIS